MKTYTVKYEYIIETEAENEEEMWENLDLDQFDILYDMLLDYQKREIVKVEEVEE